MDKSLDKPPSENDTLTENGKAASIIGFLAEVIAKLQPKGIKISQIEVSKETCTYLIQYAREIKSVSRDVELPSSDIENKPSGFMGTFWGIDVILSTSM